jgi:hypothetical protein
MRGRNRGKNSWRGLESCSVSAKWTVLGLVTLKSPLWGWAAGNCGKLLKNTAFWLPTIQDGKIQGGLETMFFAVVFVFTDQFFARAYVLFSQ